MAFPKISVIIPAFNAAATLSRAVACVVREAENIPDLEIIVVDDGSTDDTGAVALSLDPRVRVVRQDNGGPPSARNRGIRESSGPWITFLDADDEWVEGTLKTRAEALLENPDLVYVVGKTQFMEVDKNGAKTNLNPPWTSPNLGSGLYRREVYEKVGFFAEDLRYVDDIDWFWRASELGIPMKQLPETTLIYIRHAASLTAGADWRQQQLAQVIQRSLIRRRKLGLSGNVPLMTS